MPDNVVTVRSLKGTKVDQVCVGSCTNSSLYDMLKAAAMLKGRHRVPLCQYVRVPRLPAGPDQLANCGALSDILASGARLLNVPAAPASAWASPPSPAV